MASKVAPKSYAAKTFAERIQDELIESDIDQQLTLQNYKEKFHKLLCWEEKEHIDVLHHRCSGKCDVELHHNTYGHTHIKIDRKYPYFCTVSGLDGDQIAYAIQSSECAFITSHTGKEIVAEILLENFARCDDVLYLGIDDCNAAKFGQSTLSHTWIEFEVKHHYFDGLHRAIEVLPDAVVERLMPTLKHFQRMSSLPYIGHSQYEVLKLDDCPAGQTEALKLIASCPNTNPPFLITGSFGTGKTRLLAAATHMFLEQGHLSHHAVRVLVCAHHNDSADTFIDHYFGVMKYDPVYPWKEIVVRIVPNVSKYDDNKYVWLYHTVESFCGQFHPSSGASAVVVTTFSTSIKLKYQLQQGFFTHILLDEAAQAREPEAIAPLCMATKDTKMLMAGDWKQVGPALLVYGEEARKHGLRTSLLERLWSVYYHLGPDVMSLQCAELNTNYRSHPEIVKFSSKLFYNSTLFSDVPSSIAHPNAPFPLLFVCSSLDSKVESIEEMKNEFEAKVLLDQVKKFVGHWPTKEWGSKDHSTICVITPTRRQLSLMRTLMWKGGSSFNCINGISMLPSYNIQGQEYQALFIGTFEPTWRDGASRNPTKSLCDPYVFNTVLTRAKSLVVCVGNPFMLLKMEKHSTQQCWTEYLKTCLNHKTLIVPPNIKGNLEMLKELVQGEQKKLDSFASNILSASGFNLEPAIPAVPEFSHPMVVPITNPLRLHTSPPDTQVHEAACNQHYAAKEKQFEYRVEETLYLEDIQKRLSSENYKELFHKLLCWEEKEHIDILGQRCNGTFVIKYHGKDYCTKYYEDYCSFCSVESIDGDKIAYATQSSQHAVIIPLTTREEITASILPENFTLTTDCLNLGLDANNDLKLQRYMRNESRTLRAIVQFEVKHSYFDSLHDSVESLSPLVIERLMPAAKKFRPPTASFQLHVNPEFGTDIHLDADRPGEQTQALKSLLSCPNSNPPFLVVGSFGTGKTQILAAATNQFLMESLKCHKPVRILVCTHHQITADTYIEHYFGALKQTPSSPFQNILRVTSNYYRIPSGTRYNHMYINIHHYCTKFKEFSAGSLVLVTTFLTSLHLRKVARQGFFTHILLDEGAQTREPEAVAPLCLADKSTKIVIVGDTMQVGPSLLVLGKEAQQYGLSISLLERLQKSYTQLGNHILSFQTAKLITNHRSHPKLIELPSFLFYNNTLQSMVPEEISHPDAPYPLMFICTNLDYTVESVARDTDENEAQMVLDQVKYFIDRWPKERWGPHCLDNICVITPTRHQISVMRRKLKVKYKGLDGVDMRPTYEIQGREYQALFLGTIEPTWENGKSRNPTKSICDPYVFNTAITRAKSLVVTIGNPFMLLKMERHVDKPCWKEYLKLCMFHGTLVLPRSGNRTNFEYLKAVIDGTSQITDVGIHLTHSIKQETGNPGSSQSKKKHPKRKAKN